MVTVKTPGNAPFEMGSLVKLAQHMKNQSYMGHIPDRSLIELQTNTKKIMSRPITAEVQVLEVCT